MIQTDTYVIFSLQGRFELLVSVLICVYLHVFQKQAVSLPYPIVSVCYYVCISIVCSPVSHFYHVICLYQSDLYVSDKVPVKVPPNVTKVPTIIPIVITKVPTIISIDCFLNSNTSSGSITSKELFMKAPHGCNYEYIIAYGIVYHKIQGLENGSSLVFN